MNTTNQQTEETPQTDVNQLCEDIQGICEDLFCIDKAKELNALVPLAYMVGVSDKPQEEKEALLKSLQNISELLTYIQTCGSWAWDEICEATQLLKQANAK